MYGWLLTQRIPGEKFGIEPLSRIKQRIYEIKSDTVQSLVANNVIAELILVSLNATNA